VVRQLHHLLEDLTLELEAREVAAIRHYAKSLSDNQGVETHIENSADTWDRADSVVEVPHALEADLHNFWLFMLHREDHCVNNSLEHLTLQLKHSLSAVIDNIVNQLEEGFSELRMADKVIGYHLKSWLAEADKDLSQEAGEVLSLLVEDGCEEHHGLWIPRIRIRLLVVLDHGLKSWQEVDVEEVKVNFLLNIDLDKLKDISPHSLHGLDHVIVTTLLHGVADAFRVELVYLNEVLKDLAEIGKILLANA
jgi:hypothetical protein